ncbi:MAG TPA: polysaccharide deacetylase family protein [Dissulfurispiraceae bacterium]|nr:polysaccharide deacetylase family protein [Dissulfurispiraceae bacterium]
MPVRFSRTYRFLLAFCLLWLTAIDIPYAAGTEAPGVKVPILLYHRFGPVAADSMTTTTSVFRAHIEYLMSNGYTVIPLRQLVNYYLHKGPAPAAKSVVITVDDGHKTVYTDMLPIVKKYRIPVTLFIYPSAISNASYAMTWDQLRELQKTGLFDMQGHTYWHPNFKHERRKSSPSEYEKTVDMQLNKSKTRLERELGTRIDMLAWPFGIFDDYLLARASQAGYIATFTLEAHGASSSDIAMKLPRYLLNDKNRGRAFEWILTN